MYGKGADTVISSVTITGVGVAVLPATGGNVIATILAYTAIAIGVVALISQAVVRIMRKKYANAAK